MAESRSALGTTMTKSAGLLIVRDKPDVMVIAEVSDGACRCIGAFNSDSGVCVEA